MSHREIDSVALLESIHSDDKQHENDLPKGSPLHRHHVFLTWSMISWQKSSRSCVAGTIDRKASLNSTAYLTPSVVLSVILVVGFLLEKNPALGVLALTIWSSMICRGDPPLAARTNKRLLVKVRKTSSSPVVVVEVRVEGRQWRVTSRLQNSATTTPEANRNYKQNDHNGCRKNNKTAETNRNSPNVAETRRLSSTSLSMPSIAPPAATLALGKS